MSELPKGWKQQTIGSICELLNGRAFKPTDWTETGLPIVRIQNLNNSEAKFNYFDGEVRQRFLIDNGTLLFAWSGTPGTSFGAHIWNGGVAVLNQHIFKLVFDETIIDKRFLQKAINQKLEELIGKAHGGVGLRHVTKGKFESTEIAIPPLPEQRRIVAKLDSLFAQSRRAREELERVSGLCDRYRQAVLAAACSGLLTSDWREERGSEAAWKSTTLGELIIGKPKNGYSAKPVGYETPFRVLTLTATTSGKFNPEHFKYFDEIIEDESPFWVQPNDILVQRGNTIDYVGVSAIYDGAPNQFVYPDLMMRLRAKPEVMTKFLYIVLSDDKSRNFLRERATGTSGNMPKINQPTLVSLPVALPKLAEQEEVVRRVEKLFKAIAQIETEHQKAIKLCDRLDQAILTKAFSGELVPQAPTDEPADVLLDRIRSEKQETPTRKKAKSKSKSGV